MNCKPAVGNQQRKAEREQSISPSHCSGSSIGIFTFSRWTVSATGDGIGDSEKD
jgi:hypothetical protein